MNVTAQVTNAVLIIALALTHLFAYKMKFLGGVPRSIWLSIAGGITVAHVFLQMLPELKIGEGVIESQWLLDLKHPIFIALMLGVCAFYGLERHVAGEKEENGKTSQSVFWVHVITFMLYNLVLGYIISFDSHKLETKNQLLFLLSYVLHFMVNDFGLQQKHSETYKNKGRWLLAGGVCTGWILSKFVTLSEQTIVLLTAFLAGAILLNMIKEELPSDRKSKFWAFLVGVIGFSALTIMI